jgi:hypothetical protein
MIKLKTEWYHNLNRGVNLVHRNNEKYLWKLIVENKYDDMKAFIVEEERQVLDQFAADLINAVRCALHSLADASQLEQAGVKIDSEVNAFTEKHGKDNKLFASWLNGKLDSLAPPSFPANALLYWSVLKGQYHYEAVFKYVLQTVSEKQAWPKLRGLSGGVEFSNYKDISQRTKVSMLS